MAFVKSLYSQSTSCIRVTGLQSEWFEIMSGGYMVANLLVLSLHRTALPLVWIGLWTG